MADKGKKDTPKKNGVDEKQGKGAEAKTAAADTGKSGAGKAEKSEKAAGKSAAAKKAEPAKAESHGHADHAAGHGHHAPNRKEYWKIFVVLFVLTALEVAIAQLPGVGKGALYVGLIGLALAKAGCVALFYMHLKHETKVLKYTVALPFAAPALYAVVLIAEAAYRLTRSW